MRYGSTSKATSFRSPSWQERLIRAALFFIPSANPDHEQFFPRVKVWILEVDEDGAPTREIALDDTGKILFRSPDGRNLGFWTDSDVKFEVTDLEPLLREEFEAIWKRRNEN